MMNGVAELPDFQYKLAELLLLLITYQTQPARLNWSHIQVKPYEYKDTVSLNPIPLLPHQHTA